MGFILWMVFGLIVGAIAKLIMPGKDPGGWVITMLLGVSGALVGGFIGQKLGFESEARMGLGYGITAILGSILLLAAYRFFLNRKQVK